MNKNKLFVPIDFQTIAIERIKNSIGHGLMDSEKSMRKHIAQTIGSDLGEEFKVIFVAIWRLDRQNNPVSVGRKASEQIPK